MKIIISLLVLLCLNQIALSQYTYFQVQDDRCQHTNVLEIDECLATTSGSSIEGCTGSIHIVANDNGDDNQFSFEKYTGNNECSLADATTSLDFTCLTEGIAQNVTTADNSTTYTITCFTQDPYTPKFSYFKVEKHLCQDRRDMVLDTCLSVSTAAMPNCNGSVDIRFSGFGLTYNFDVFTNDNCSLTPFRVGPFDCKEDGVQVQAKGFVVTCYVNDYLSSSSKLNISFIMLFSLLLLLFIF